MRNKLTCLSPVFLILWLITSLVLPEHAFTQNQTSFLWRIRSKTATVHILGSLHLFKKEFYPLNKTIDEAFDQSQVLVVEANIQEPGKMNVQGLKEKAFFKEGDDLGKHVSIETYELIKKEAARLGIPMEAVRKQKPWFLAMALEAMELLRLGFDPRYGIDMNFLLKAKGKEILELEGIDYQFNLLSGFSEKEQELLLLYTLKDLSIISRQMNQYVSAWTSGDVKAVEALMMQGMTEEVKQSSLPEKFFYERNRNMTAKIEDLLKTEKTYFVIVGAGHLVGSQGIIELLAGKGYAVEQR